MPVYNPQPNKTITHLYAHDLFYFFGSITGAGRTPSSEAAEILKSRPAKSSVPERQT